MLSRRGTLLSFLALALAGGLLWIVSSGEGDPGPGGMATPPGRAAADPAVPTATGPAPGRTPLAAPAATDGSSVLRLRGRVLDPFGEPVGSALVGEPGAASPASTDAQGCFTLEVARGRKAIGLLVLAAAHAPCLADVELPGGVATHDAGDLQLVRAGWIRGQTTDPSGAPLPGSTVTLRWLSSGGAALPADLGALLPPVRSDASGAYGFVGLAPGTYRVSASVPGRLPRSSGTLMVREDSETRVDPLALAAGYELSGAVLGTDDVPLAGAAVRIESGANQPRFDARTESAADGRFRVDAVPPGPLRVVVTRAGYLRFQSADVAVPRREELVVRLQAGLRVAGTVVDARDRRPVQRFAASIRKVGEVDPGQNGTIAQQLERQIDVLRAEAAAAEDAQGREQKLEIAAQFAARLAAVRNAARERPVMVPAERGGAEQHRPGGRFAFEGLEEGLYVVGIAPPDHVYAEVEPVEVRRGAPAPELRVEVRVGHAVSGQVIAKREGRPVAGAEVELVRISEAPRAADASRRSLYPWAFARSGPDGIPVMGTRSGADGHFAFHQAAAGRYLLAVRHPGNVHANEVAACIECRATTHARIEDAGEMNRRAVAAAHHAAEGAGGHRKTEIQRVAEREDWFAESHRRLRRTGEHGY